MTLDLSTFYAPTVQAKLADLPDYEAKTRISRLVKAVEATVNWWSFVEMENRLRFPSPA